MKNSSDAIGNRTRDLLTCSAVPQPTAPPRSRALRAVAKKKAKSLFRHVCPSVCVQQRKNPAPTGRL